MSRWNSTIPQRWHLLLLTASIKRNCGAGFGWPRSFISERNLIMNEYHEVAREDGIHICSEKCSTCIFYPGNRMKLRDGRVRGLVQEALEDGGMIPCHKTVRRDDIKPAICRGFFDSYSERIPLL